MAEPGLMARPQQVSTHAPRHGAGVVWLFGATSFLSAYLLFLIQPMYAKMLLPLLGGSPSVWNTALVFYQAALLLGYLWAHTSGRLGLGRHAWVHFGLFAVAFTVLPFGVARAGSPPVDVNPIPWQLGTMVLGVGLPFFVVAAGAPLIQRWFSQTGHRRAGDPYFLYAASNFGSMVALLGYPTLIEPTLRLGRQSLVWTVGFGLLAVAMAGCAWVGARESGAPGSATGAKEESIESPTWLRRGRWVALAFVPSALMMGVTTYLTTDVASVPLLWVGPLALYLLTFIIVFARRQWIPHQFVAWMLAPMLLMTLLAVTIPITKPAIGLAVLGLTTFFFACWVCHGELAADRPAAKWLTEFYIWLSLGGVLGGAFCALVAPLVFNTVLEYSIALVLCAALLPLGIKRLATPLTYALDVLWVAVMVTALGLLIVHPLREIVPGLDTLPLNDRNLDLLLSYGLVAFVALSLLRRPARFGLACAAILTVGLMASPARERILFQERSFFGVLRVEESAVTGFRFLYHGTTLHGLQHTDPEMADMPTTYYHRTGPMGLAMADLQRRKPELRVAVVGLGTGTLAAYGRPGDEYTFYEIDPAVVRIASDPEFYTFLSASSATCRFVLGDARLSLARTDRQYDLIVLDAYSSDAVPLHLLTREALRVYLARLAPGGVIAFHISNRHLEFEPVVEGLVRDADLQARIYSDDGLDLQAQMEGKYASEWVMAARRLQDLGSLSGDERWQTLRRDPNLRLWTDDYTSLWGVVNL